MGYIIMHWADTMRDFTLIVGQGDLHFKVQRFTIVINILFIVCIILYVLNGTLIQIK